MIVQSTHVFARGPIEVELDWNWMNENNSRYEQIFYDHKYTEIKGDLPSDDLLVSHPNLNLGNNFLLCHRIPTARMPLPPIYVSGGRHLYKDYGLWNNTHFVYGDWLWAMTWEASYKTSSAVVKLYLHEGTLVDNVWPEIEAEIWKNI